MLISEISTKYKTTTEIVEEALLVSGFPIDYTQAYEAKDVNLSGLYIRYLMMMSEAEEAAYGFKYGDGEENVDKTSVNDNMRRTALIWYDRWESEMKKREDATNNQFSSFHIRGRA